MPQNTIMIRHARFKLVFALLSICLAHKISTAAHKKDRFDTLLPFPFPDSSPIARYNTYTLIHQNVIYGSNKTKHQAVRAYTTPFLPSLYSTIYLLAVEIVLSFIYGLPFGNIEHNPFTFYLPLHISRSLLHPSSPFALLSSFFIVETHTHRHIWNLCFLCLSLSSFCQKKLATKARFSNVGRSLFTFYLFIFPDGL